MELAIGIEIFVSVNGDKRIEKIVEKLEQRGLQKMIALRFTKKIIQ